MKSLLQTLPIVVILLPLLATAQPMNDEVSYSHDIRPIIKNFCVTCHAGDDPEGDFVLTSYKDVRHYTEKGDLLDRINDAKDPMPESGLMPPYLRRVFRVWADTGYLENGTKPKAKERTDVQKFEPPAIAPVDITKEGFEMLEALQGHWVGSMNLMGTDYDWMAFDYRPIAPSHVHGIFEGGTVGNLFTSFFVADFKGTQTLMARNGGMLNGIYRTSYFVLEKITKRRGGKSYRFVDAYGGDGIMWMELTFKGASLEFKAYTSRFGMTEPRQHMVFKGKRTQPEIAARAAKTVGFPQQIDAFDFSKGLPKPTWADDYPLTSASYIREEAGKTLIELGTIAKDPIRIDQMPHLGSLAVAIERSPATVGKKLHIYLSSKALVKPDGTFISRYGYIREELLNTLLTFPELGGKQSDFTFTYLHPGDYFITVIADMDNDGLPSRGDITHRLRNVTVKPEAETTVRINDLTVKN